MKSRQNWNLVLCYQVVAILYTNCSPRKYSASNFPTLYNTRFPHYITQGTLVYVTVYYGEVLNTDTLSTFKRT